MTTNRTRIIQALSCATIVGAIWSLSNIPSLVRFALSEFSDLVWNRWDYFCIFLDKARAVIAGLVAIRILLKLKKLRILCWTTIVVIVVDLCIFGVRWFPLMRSFSLSFSILQFVLCYVVPLALLTLRLSGESELRDESGADKETLDAETKTRYRILYAFLVPVLIGLWVGARLLLPSRILAVFALSLGLGLGIAWTRRLGVRNGLIQRLLDAIVRAIVDLFAGIKALFAGINRLSGRSSNQRLKREADAIRGLLGLGVVTLSACAVYGVWLFSTLNWKGDSKNIPISDSVSIELRSVPGNLWFGQYEVTQAQWVAVMGLNPARFDKDENNPVENVSWYDCQEFLKKLNELPAVKQSGLTFRLPTEAEWESACRARARGDYCKLDDGTEITADTLGSVAWFHDNSDGKTHPVGQKEPNAFGLYDMRGNVLEWTATADGEDRVHCGGSWYGSAGSCGSSFRGGSSPSDRGSDLGFRLCAEKTEKTEARVAAERKAKEEKAKKLLSSPVVKAAAEAILDEMVPIPGTDYMIGKTEVTQSQWKAIMGENPSCFAGENNPVDSVSWYDCQGFLSLLNSIPAVKQSGLMFRLPTATEWEYACRALEVDRAALVGRVVDAEVLRALGLARDYYCKLDDGTEITADTLGSVAWFKDNSNEKTHPVGLKQPNAFGLYDMHGNVCVWTSTDHFGWRKAIRGGSWDDSAEDCVSSTTWRSDSPFYRGRNLGLRLCAENIDKTEAKAAAERKVREEREAAATEAILAEMVQIPGKDYKIGKTEVTQAKWEAVMGENPSRFKGADNPVECVSWDDCQEFLKKFNALPAVKKSGLTFRLPTEEEWEYACRAGATGDFCRLADGTEITRETLGRVAWFEANSDQKTHPVGQKQPNAFGLYDMHGNVWEWTSTAGGLIRVYRGGSWFLSAWSCESSLRHRDLADSRNFNLGFRLCASGSAD